MTNERMEMIMCVPLTMMRNSMKKKLWNIV